tara:strand:- start:3358 stop:3840 length:483 start_codon:yes stop_codon:yes gene_type:complete
MASHTVIDNFLDKKQFETLSKMVMGLNFPWYFQADINENDKKHTYLTHIMYDNYIVNSQHFNDFLNLVLSLKPKALLRVKANCYLRTPRIVKHGVHVDYKFPHKGALFYLNTNNGKTILDDGKEITSVANRMLFFDPSKMHSSTSCSDQKARFNINFNYL